MSMENPLQSFMQALFEQRSTCEANIKTIDDNCAMMPESEAKTAQHERLSRSFSQSSFPELSRWDSHPMRIDRDERCGKPSAATLRCPTCPIRRASVDDNIEMYIIEESKHQCQALPPRCPRRRASVIESVSPIRTVDQDLSDVYLPPLDSSESSIDSFLVYLKSSLTDSSRRTLVVVDESLSDLSETKIHTDLLFRSSLSLLDRPSYCTKRRKT